MTLQERIDALVELGNRLNSNDEKLESVVQQAYIHNRWFTIENCRKAIQNIADAFLQKDKLENWVKAYDIKTDTPKAVGLVMAGNIPLVGFHDFMCVFITGHKAKIKLSDKDTVLMEFVFNTLIDINPNIQNYIEKIERLTDFGAVIATGSNNTARYFEAYFSKVPNIIRKNRTSVAVLSGDETMEELKEFGNDVFEYFGLGCRNVSKLFVPKDYNFEPLIEAFHSFNEIVYHNKYKNNYDYNFTLMTMNKIPTIFGTCMLLSENEGFQSRIAQMHFSYYDDKTVLEEKLKAHESEIQCVVSKNPIGNISNIQFGGTQVPSLSDYADGVDTMEFLVNI
ncbi:MAG: hypothetical protein ACI97N_001724 [Cognaticolwellia sp.]|jgi:hypothetical protein